jgi:AcrR family transcriptional regulator
MARIGREQRAELTEARRLQLLEAAVRLCASRGFDAVSVESIAREAGLSKGAVYLYFPTKQAILDAALQRYSLLPEMSELLAAYRDVHPREAIPEIVRALWLALKQRSELIGIFLREVPLSPENSELFLKRIVYPGNGALAAYFQGWIDAGVMRPLPPVGLSGTLLGSLLSFLLIQDVFGGTKFHPIPDDEVVGTVSAVLLSGALRSERVAATRRRSSARPRPPSHPSPPKRHPL